LSDINGEGRKYTLVTSPESGATLSVEVLDQYRAQRLGEKVGRATISREMATLKHALSKAVEWKLLRKALREELTAIKKYQEPARWTIAVFVRR
jgi:hypothetical protein